MAPTDATTSINLRLALLNLPLVGADLDPEITGLVAPILARQRELNRQLADNLCPVDQRIQGFLDDYLADVAPAPRLPRASFVLDEPGLARTLSLPARSDKFESSLLTSYRLTNGVLHNPRSDRRTTAGVFHIAEGGLPINQDKRAVPKATWGRLLELAFQPPQELTLLPFGADEHTPPHCFVSLLMRPIVVPEVPGYTGQKTMEIRFIAPGSLVANLDFVEGIFGNGGDPNLPTNDAALDPITWTGHTGCVILAPHLTSFTKKALGLPRYEDATERQRRDHMCWQDESELYNDGQAFKAVARDERGVIVTIIADNYFGYCKKEVKTQIGYSANLYGASEEEHSGGALVYPSYDLGAEFVNPYVDSMYTLGNVIDRDPRRFERQPQGYALDREEPTFVLVPASAKFDLETSSVSWLDSAGEPQSIPLRADRTYFGPDGYRVRLQQSALDPTSWTLIGTSAVATSCHKPSTVSGGGKSEISKAISDAFIYGSAFVPDINRDLDMVGEIIERNYADRFADPHNGGDDRKVLSARRSVGSVIKLLTPSPDFTSEYNAWLASIPAHILELVIVVKRAYRPEWGDDWRSHFSVGVINGREGNALRLDGERIIVNMLRVGFETDGSWRVFSLRPDYSPAMKVQTEDDITASTVAPPQHVNRDGRSAKFVANCEKLLFQRPDDAIHRGYDTQAEADIAAPGTFLSNFEPLTHEDGRAMSADAVAFSRFTQPMRDLISTVAAMPDDASPLYFVSSADPRIVDGARTKNPRYLQVRPDLARPLETAAADLASHLRANVPTRRSLPLPVDIVAAGRRNNPPGDGVPALCAFNPLHALELPELFMEFISSMTGKSPSTTGAGSEGALTKAPFNAMPTIFDLNAALLSYVLGGYDGWLSAAGYVGPKIRVDHDVSLLVPEVFSRMRPSERDAARLIENGFLEKVEDFEYEGELVLASRLGYRMNERFVATYFARIFVHPQVVFTPEMLRPELQDMPAFVETMRTMVTTHERVARMYIDDGTIELACPPLRALLEIMANGVTSQGLDLHSAQVRELFDRENVLASQWYAERLDARAAEAVRHANAGVAALDAFLAGSENAFAIDELDVRARRRAAKERLTKVTSPTFRAGMVGALGRQPRMR